MFTGIIEEIGVVKSVVKIGGGKKITVQAEKVMSDLKIDDSISLNGICQTIVSRTSNTFTVEAVEETIKKTTINKFLPGRRINLERAVRIGDRMGGHIVQGHVDTVGKIISIQQLATAKIVWVSLPVHFTKYVVPQGSICIDGVSLTLAQVEKFQIMVSIIPHTWEMTLFKELKAGTEVNLEFDIIGKYVEKLVNPYFQKDNKAKSILEGYIDQPEY